MVIKIGSQQQNETTRYDMTWIVTFFHQVARSSRSREHRKEEEEEECSFFLATASETRLGIPLPFLRRLPRNGRIG